MAVPSVAIVVDVDVDVDVTFKNLPKLWHFLFETESDEAIHFKPSSSIACQCYKILWS
jgi:hypothetical protein